MAHYIQGRLFARLLSSRASFFTKVFQCKAGTKTFQSFQPTNHFFKRETSQYFSYSSMAWQDRYQMGAKSLFLDPMGKTCSITWEDGFQSLFHSAWLRHNCHCEECRHPNGQKLIDAAVLSCALQIDSAELDGESLILSWSGRDGAHKGEVPLSFLRANNYNRDTIRERQEQAKCNIATEIPSVLYHDIISDKDWHMRWLQQINEDGISLIKEVPYGEDILQKVAELVGPLMPHIYGTTFDVEVAPDPINVAYSDLGIDLHQDIAYFESPPGIQLLHCLEFDDCVEGGENIFLDVFDVVDKFRITHPDLFNTLCTVPATFQKVHYSRDVPVHIVNQKPHIKLNHLGEVVAVYWAPPFEGALSVAGEDVENYFLAYGTFAKTLKKSSKLKHRLRPGEMVIFNNLRILHGRAAFQANGGRRRLKGCYLNVDMFKSQVQVINNLNGDGRLAKRVGNQCWF